MTKKVVNWVAQIKYPNLKPIWFGTITCDLDLSHAQIEQLMRAAILEHAPDGFAILDLQRGQAWITFE